MWHTYWQTDIRTLWAESGKKNHWKNIKVAIKYPKMYHKVSMKLTKIYKPNMTILYYIWGVQSCSCSYSFTIRWSLPGFWNRVEWRLLTDAGSSFKCFYSLRIILNFFYNLWADILFSSVEKIYSRRKICIEILKHGNVYIQNMLTYNMVKKHVAIGVLKEKYTKTKK